MVCYERNYDYWALFSYEIITLNRCVAHILTQYVIKRELMSFVFSKTIQYLTQNTTV